MDSITIQWILMFFSLMCPINCHQSEFFWLTFSVTLPPMPGLACLVAKWSFIVCPWLWQIDDVCKRQQAAVQ